MRKIIKIVVFAMLLLSVNNGVWARRVPLEKAERYAHNWWLQKDGNRNAVLSHVETEFENIYLFVDTGGRGFVMLAADDRSLPVLGYSLRNNFVADSMPAHVHDWVKDYDDQIQWLIDNNIEKTNEINEQWKNLENERRQLPTAYPTAVGPLVQTQWNQGSPYNYKCPSGTYTGCVATAMAQILKYHEWPATGTGSYSYTWNSKTLSANFANTTYDWNNMINKYSSSYYTTTQRNAVATLMYHVGIAVKMDYGTSGSSAATTATSFDDPAAVNAYKKYFKYKWTATSVFIEDYTDTEWKLLLKNEIDNNRPIQYSGRSKSGGHSFVFDGYDTDEKFHVNWGWGGTDDAFYAIGHLNPAPGGIGGNEESSYNLSNKAVIGIEPDRSKSSTVSITASSNNTSWGTVTPSGIGNYTRFVDMVSITPSANTGYRFAKWSTGSSDVPLKFLASGDNETITANFEPIAGDTLHYCKDAHASSYSLTSTGTNYWGIRIPKTSLISGKLLTHVMLYPYEAGSYTLTVYSGNFTTSLHSQTFNITETDKWVTLELNTYLQIDATKDLCVTFSHSGGYPCTVSASAANSYASYGRTSSTSSWSSYTSGGVNLTWMIKAITAPVHQITMDPDLVNLTSATKDYNLRNVDLGVSNKASTVSYEIVSSTPAGIATITDGCKITATGSGTVKIKATANDSKFGYAENTIDLPITKGSLVFDGHGGNSWNDADSWWPHYDRLPDATNFDANVNVTCTIPAGSKVECNDLMINATGNVTVASTAVLNVEGELTSDDPAKLLIKSDKNGSGTVVYQAGSPKATVEMYMKGTAESDGDGGIINPEWQLRGCIVSDFTLADPQDWANIHVYRWSESNNAHGCWTENMVGSAIKLDPWWGYGFANYSTDPVTLKYTGTLKNGNYRLVLSKTGNGNANVGNNMFTNSYAAPLRIARLDFENTKSSVIFYNTGSWLDWQRYGGDTTSANVGTTAGQMLVCPKNTSAIAGLPTTIPSGQSFYVVAEENNASVTTYYSDIDDSNSSGPMFLPKDKENEERFNVLGITITGKKGGDRVVLIENENCNDDYNDGYDGMKYSGDAELPQLFAVNEFGNTSINAAKSMLGQKIGVTTQTAGEVLRMTFETDKLNDFAQLQVLDHAANRYINVLAGEEYEFVSTDNDKSRFEIVGFRMRNEMQDEIAGIWVCNDHLFVGDYDGRMMMCDMSGKIVWQADVHKNEWVNLPEYLHGVYVIKTSGSTIKIVK